MLMIRIERGRALHTARSQQHRRNIAWKLVSWLYLGRMYLCVVHPRAKLCQVRQKRAGAAERNALLLEGKRDAVGYLR